MTSDIGSIVDGAWAVPSGWTLHYASVTDSTNDDARAAVHRGVADRTIFLADAQRKGRGRMNRSWVAPAGGSLLVSLVLMRELKPVELMALCSVSIVETIAEVVGLPARIKWPNDVMIGQRKVCGILTEVASRGGGAYAAIVGIGLNVNLDPVASGLPPTATSLSREFGRPVAREMIFSHLIGLLDARLRWDDATLAPWLRSRWESLLWRRRQRVTVAQDGRTLFGVVEGLAESGALLLRGDDGLIFEIVAGDVASG